ncbi:MAG: DnrO protein [Lysobacter sp.]
MKPAVTITVVPLLLLAAMTAPLARAQNGHDHHAPATAVAQAVPAQRWATDAPLRTGMGRIRTAVDALQHYERGHMGPEQAIALATQIEGDVTYLVANCKLQPQADVALHVIIAELVAGAQALKANPANLAAIPPMREVLADYARNFNDPGFGQDTAVD